MPTNFEKIIEFHRAFGLKTTNEPQTNVVQNDPALVNLRLSLIDEEHNELKDAVKDNNFVEIIDALTDILYVVYGAGTSFGINMDRAFELVHASNMTKLCVSEEEAQQTVHWYKDNEFARYDSPAYRRSDDGVHWVVYNESTGKVLKSINYRPVSFESLLQA